MKRKHYQDSKPVLVEILQETPNGSKAVHVERAKALKDPGMRGQIIEGLLIRFFELRAECWDIEELAPLVKVIDKMEETFYVDVGGEE